MSICLLRQEWHEKASAANEEISRELKKIHDAVTAGQACLPPTICGGLLRQHRAGALHLLLRQGQIPRLADQRLAL